MAMEIFLSALNFNVASDVALVVIPTYRDTVRIPFSLSLLNYMFFFRNGNYYVNPTINQFNRNVWKATTVTSNKTLTEDALTYVANGEPLANFSNVNTWTNNFNTVFAEKMTTLDNLLLSFNRSNGTNADLVTSGGYKHFPITDVRNLAYVAASTIGWQPPNGWQTDTDYPIEFDSGTSLYFTARCTFSPNTISPVNYKISFLFCSVSYVNIGDNIGVPVDTNVYEVGDTVVVLGQGTITGPTGLVFSGWSNNLSADIYTVGDEFTFSDNIILSANWSTP